jgi:hypothetical protein
MTAILTGSPAGAPPGPLTALAAITDPAGPGGTAVSHDRGVPYPALLFTVR